MARKTPYEKVWLNVQLNAIKSGFADQEKKLFVEQDKIWTYISDGYRIFCVPAEMTFLDFSKFASAKGGLIRHFENADKRNTSPAYFTGNARMTYKDGKPFKRVLEVVGDNGVRTWLNESFVKDAGGCLNLVCRVGEKRTDPVIVECIGGPVIGLILPVNIPA